uniref:DEAD/DEAH box helicase n=1 Tax=Nitrospira cf. moscoviensis SBR1015 TaxID=96242 RepID=UPI000B3BB6B7|nr:DEAD/DEAH box helicase [Nitrospira cf. moscoviensis SBR1015]
MPSRSMTRQRELFARSPEQWKPHKFQKAGVKWLLEHACAALFADPGVGKTSMTLGALKLLIGGGHASKVLIVAPRRVCYEVWPKEIEKWKDFNHLTIEVLHGPDKDEALARDADIYVINPEGLDWLLGCTKVTTASGKRSSSVNQKRWKDLGFDTLVVDELSKFKHSQTQRFKTLKQVLGSFRRRWGLTGSPAANGLMDLFGQAYVLDMGNALGQYVTHYRTKYFVPAWDGFSWTPKEGAEERIYEAMAPLVMRIGSEHLDLPTLVDQTIEVALPASAVRMYEELEEHLITQMDDGFITAANAAVASSKCRQVASGAVYLDEGVDVGKNKKVHRIGKRTWADIHDAKLDALEELVDGLQGKPLLVGYDFQHDLAHIQQRFGDVPYIGGGVTDKRANELVDQWNDGQLPLLLGHPASMGHGLNLQSGACSHVAWFSLTWDFELYDQFIKRVHRQGNKTDRVFVYHLTAAGTIDEAVYWALKSKKKGQNALFEGLKLIKNKRRR